MKTCIMLKVNNGLTVNTQIIFVLNVNEYFSFEVFSHMYSVWTVFHLLLGFKLHLLLGFKLHSVFRFVVTFPRHLLRNEDLRNYFAANKELKLQSFSQHCFFETF